MYRKDAELMQFEQGLNSLGRDDINSLEIELSKVYSEYQNPTNAQVVLGINTIYNTAQLEQKLGIVRERKQYFNKIFAVQDKIEDCGRDLREFKFFYKLGIVSSAIFATVSTIALQFESVEAYFFTGVGTAGLILSCVVTVGNLKYQKIKTQQLKELKETSNLEKRLLPKPEELEILQLPSPEMKDGVK